MKKTTYSGKSIKELTEALSARQEDLRKLRFGTAGSKTRNIKESVTMRRDIARILTELNSSTKLTASKK